MLFRLQWTHFFAEKSETLNLKVVADEAFQHMRMVSIFGMSVEGARVVLQRNRILHHYLGIVQIY